MSEGTVAYLHTAGLDFSIHHTAIGPQVAILKNMLVHLGLEALRSGDKDRVREITELLRERGRGDA